MLRWMRIRNVAVIERLEIDFESGLNLLTGETGAGKSILVDALGLVLGARASTDLVRTGEETALVEAGFEFGALPEGLRQRLEQAGVEPGEEEVIIRREVSGSGRGRVAINGSAGATSFLREIASYLADIHGQGESATLLGAEAGVALLDHLGGSGPERAEVEELYRSLVSVEREIEDLDREARDRESRRELLSYQVDEIERAGLQAGEDQSLEEERRRLAQSEKLIGLAQQAYEALYEEEDSALARLSQMWKKLSELAAIDSRLSPYLGSRETLTSELEELALFLRDYREEIRFAPARLDEVEARLAQVERLKKKYGGSLEAVLSHRERCREQLGSLESTGERLTRLRGESEQAGSLYLERAGQLSTRRRRAAEELETTIGRELRALAMEKARFCVEFAGNAGVAGIPGDERSGAPRAGWQPSGIDRVELVFSANPGEDLRPLSRAASGGELSRLMLALKSVAARGEAPKTLVFDEVDAGIGGRVAEVVGGKLKDLSRFHQVICVTHLPQIASFADAHFRIDKKELKGRTVTRIERLDRQGRVNEIARMLAGRVITETARRHAEQLVADKS